MKVSQANQAPFHPLSVVACRSLADPALVIERTGLLSLSFGSSGWTNIVKEPTVKPCGEARVG